MEEADAICAKGRLDFACFLFFEDLGEEYLDFMRWDFWQDYDN